MRENRPLKAKVCAILTLITLSILVIFFVFLPSIFISDAISFVASGSSIFFPIVPDTNFLWFLPKDFHGLPLSLGQFLDICIILIILFQIASTIYIMLARFYKYQPSSSEIPIEVKRKYETSLPNFMRWNILPHGHQIIGEKLGDGEFWQEKYATNNLEFQRTSYEQKASYPTKRKNTLHCPFLISAVSKSRSLPSCYIIDLLHQHLLDCNILVVSFARSVPAPDDSWACYLPLILPSSCFSRLSNFIQKLEVVA